VTCFLETLAYFQLTIPEDRTLQSRYWSQKEPSQNVKQMLKRNWKKLVLGLNSVLGEPSRFPYERLLFQKCQEYLLEDCQN
jgi:hypothetical protein